MTRTCAVCRTSLDEYPVTCDHGEVFCGGCSFEDGCEWCDRLATNAQIWADADNGPRPTWTPGQEDAETWAEQRAEERRLPHIDPREDDRAGDRDWERRWPA